MTDAAVTGRARGVAVAGGKGSGKSAAACRLAVLACLTRPKAQVTLAMDNHKSLNDIHQPLLWEMCPGAGAVWRETKGEWWFTSGPGAGGILRLRHLDMAGDPMSGRSPLEGPTLDALIVDECQKVDPAYFTVALERTRQAPDPNGAPRLPPFVGFFGLPINTWWMALCESQGWPTFRPRTRDNAANLSATYEADLRRVYTARQARALLDGEELAPEGAIFDGFIPSLERDGGGGGTVTTEPIDWAHAQTCLVIDPGARRPFATLFARNLGGSGRWIIAANWAPGDGSTEIKVDRMSREVLADCKLRRDWNTDCGRMPIDDIVMDVAGQHLGGDPRNHREYIRQWSDPQPDGLGMRPRVNLDPARVSVELGIQRTQLAFEHGRLAMAEALYRKCLTDPPKARNILRCLMNYTRGADGKPLKFTGFDDGADTIRYFVMGSDLWDDGTPSAVGQAFAAQISGPERRTVVW